MNTLEKIPRLSFAEYAAIPRMNAGTLVWGHLKTMKYMRWYMQNRKEPTDAMLFGSQYHELILEPETFEQRFCVMPNYAAMPENVTSKGDRSDSWATSFCKECVVAFSTLAEIEGREVISRKDYDRGLMMLESINDNPEAEQIIEHCEKEVTLFGEIEGVPMKCRLDLCGSGMIADLKGVNNIDSDAFGRKAADLGYAFRLALYHEIYRQNFACEPSVEVIAVLTTDDFDCTVITLPTIERENALSNVKETCRKYKWCVENNSWPGVGQRSEWRTPFWAMPREDEEPDNMDWSGIE